MNVNNFIKGIFRGSEDLDKSIYQEFLVKQLILRDYLSIERTILANESTFLAYIRTSLTISVVGVTLFQLSQSNEAFQYIGIVLALSGVYIFLAGSVRTVIMRKKINKFLEKRQEVETITDAGKLT